MHSGHCEHVTPLNKLNKDSLCNYRNKAVLKFGYEKHRNGQDNPVMH